MHQKQTEKKLEQEMAQRLHLAYVAGMHEVTGI